MFAEDVGRAAIGERIAPAQASGYLGQDPPVGASLAGQRQEGALARNAPLRVGDCAVLFAPGGRGQADMRRAHAVVAGDVLGDDEQVEFCQRGAHAVGVGQADGRVGAHHPQRLDLAARNGVEHGDGLYAFAADEVWRPPETPDDVALGFGKTHMRGQHVGKAADLASAHGVGLAGERERPGAGLADAPGGEVAVDDGVDLVGALRRLVDALRIDGDGFAGLGKPAIEGLDIGDV